MPEISDEAVRAAMASRSRDLIDLPDPMVLSDERLARRMLEAALPFLTAQEAEPVPPGRYAGGARSPIVWAYLCSPCGGYAPLTGDDYHGALSGQCQGCGTWTREIHRFRAFIDSASGCGCRTEHKQRTGDLHAATTTEAPRA